MVQQVGNDLEVCHVVDGQLVGMPAPEECLQDNI
jgi:hypothetical protein